jgi:hypothetical protein
MTICTRPKHRNVAILLSAALVLATTTMPTRTAAFVVVPSPSSSVHHHQEGLRPFSSFSKLWMGTGKGKKGKLGSLLSDIGTTSPTPKTRQASAPTRKKTASTGTKQGSDVSPDLAAWMSTKTDSDGAAESSRTKVRPAKDKVERGAVFSSFEEEEESDSKSKKGRRAKQSSRQASDTARDEQVEPLLKQLEELLVDVKSKETTVSDILNTVRQLMQLPADNLRQLAVGSASRDYRLAWVGSDDAVTYLGTGLHKVPLARLQEVFLTMQGKGRIQVQEVIRILGPFPTIKNNLEGSCKVDKLSEDATAWSITWDSMVDGTGNQLLSGKQENVKTVDLQVYYCDPSILVAVVPPPSSEDGGPVVDVRTLRPDPLEKDGAHVMVFVREEDLDGKLESLRVA